MDLFSLLTKQINDRETDREKKMNRKIKIRAETCSNDRVRERVS